MIAAHIVRTHAIIALVGLSAGGCVAHEGPQALNARAATEWTRSYPLDPGGEFQIVGGNGVVDVRGGPGSTVDVKAELVAHAASDATARDVVPRIRIREDVKPEKIVLTTEGLGGIVIGVTVEVNYHVTVPASANVRLRTANGSIQVSGVTGRVVASSTNGEVTARELGGGVDARVVNGKVNVDLATFANQPVDVRAVNGSAALTVPASADAILTASSTNGAINTEGVTLEPIGEQTRRRIRGRLNAGGSPIEITAVNGDVRVQTRP